MSASINEKLCIVDMVFLRNLREKHQSELLVDGIYMNVKEFVCEKIDSSIQPILLIVESDPVIVNRNVIRTPICFEM